VQAQETPGATLYTVAPRLQSGSPGSLPMIVTGFGAERPRNGAPVRYRALVSVSNARGFGGFSNAESRQAPGIEVQVLSRASDCLGTPACLYTETLLLTFPPAALRQAAEAGTPIRIRLNGNAAFVETAIPATHLRALGEALPFPTGG
jgi:hypothetical protein